MSSFNDAELIINYLVDNNFIEEKNWKQYKPNNNSKYNVNFNRVSGLNCGISFEIMVRNNKYLIRQQNIKLSLARLEIQREIIDKLINDSSI